MNFINSFRENRLRNGLTQELARKDVSGSRIADRLKKSPLANKVAIFEQAFKEALAKDPHNQREALLSAKEFVDLQLEPEGKELPKRSRIPTFPLLVIPDTTHDLGPPITETVPANDSVSESSQLYEAIQKEISSPRVTTDRLSKILEDSSLDGKIYVFVNVCKDALRAGTLNADQIRNLDSSINEHLLDFNALSKREGMAILSLIATLQRINRPTRP